MSIDEIRGTVEKEIAEKEYQLKLKKKGKSKDKKDNTAPAQSAEVIEIDDDAWEIPSGDDAVDSTAKPKKSDTGSSAAKEVSAERKAAMEREKKWKNEVGTAAKCVSSLNSVCQTLKSMVPRCEKAPEGVIDSRLLDGLKEAETTMNTWKLRACSAYL